MIDLGIKLKQLILGMMMGFSLVMFFPTSLVWSRSNEPAVASAILEPPIPESIVIGVALVFVTLHLIMALGAMGLGWWKTSQGEPSLEILRIAMLVSAIGIAIALTSFQLNSALLNSISLVAIIVNSGTLVTSFLFTFASQE